MISGVHPGFSLSEMLSPTPALLAELSKKSQELEAATPEDILRWEATARFGKHFTMATAFGPEGMCILHMLAETRLVLTSSISIPVINFKNAELRERVAKRYGIQIDMRKPATTVAQYEQSNNGPLYQTNPNQCCGDRKVKVLEETVIGFHAWASAIRRDQSSDRRSPRLSAGIKNSRLSKSVRWRIGLKKDVWKKNRQR